MTLCKRSCHVDPYKIGPCLRTFSKFKLKCPTLSLNRIRRRILTGYSQDSFNEAKVTKWVHKNGCAVSAIYALCTGAAAHRHLFNITENRRRIFYKKFIRILSDSHINFIIRPTCISGFPTIDLIFAVDRLRTIADTLYLDFSESYLLIIFRRSFGKHKFTHFHKTMTENESVH